MGVTRHLRAVFREPGLTGIATQTVRLRTYVTASAALVITCAPDAPG
jgi:hypothetical protein